NDTIISKNIYLNKIEKAVDVTAEKVEEEPEDDVTDKADKTDKTEEQKPLSPQEKKDLELSTIHYPFNVVKITPKARYQLDKLATQLKTSYKDVNIVIASHTDNIDTREYNMKLSKRRTLTVMNYLMSKGIESSRLIGQWYGEEQPIAPNQLEDGRDNPQGRWLNRRTVFSPVEKGASVKQGQMAAIDKDSYQPKGVENMGAELDEMTFNTIVKKYGEEKKDGLVFKIQIGAYRNPKKYMKYKMKMYAELQEKISYLIQREVEGGLSKFLAGKAYSLNKAVELRDEIRDAGVKNAFIVAYYNRERINIVDVIEILREKEQDVVEETPEIMQDTVPVE
ncbi:MAG: OmpA family protein, partial [Bacteroidota bacterium]